MSKDASSSPPELPKVELPNDIAALQAIILQQQATITQLAQTNAEYQQSIEQQAHRIAQLLRQHFGPRREHIDPSQLTLFSKHELDALAKEMSSEPTPHPTIPDAVLPEEDAKSSKKRRKSGHGRRRLPIHLPCKCSRRYLGKTITARFWTYIGDRDHPYTVYDFTESRKRDGPAKFLHGFRGYLQADAYGGYDGIYTGSHGTIHEVACSAHARRYWFKAKETDPVRSHHALGVFARLYQIERSCATMSDDERRSFRQQHALPIWLEFREWIDAQPQWLPKSPIGQAAMYTLNQWDALLRYCDDGELTIDNNVSEQTVKMQAIGRKNWLFVGSHEGGCRAAILFSLVASCKANRVEPWAYLNDLFTHLPTIPADQPELLDAFLPDRWLATHPQHAWTIDELRRRERERNSP